MSKNNNFKNHVLIFFVSPLLGLILAIKYFRFSYSKNIIWLFIIFYGFILINSVDGADSQKYATWFVEMSKRKVDISSIFQNFYADDESLDIFRSFTLILISRFTNSPSVYFACIGAFYGFFYSRIVWYVLSRVNHKFGFYQSIFFCTFLFIFPFYDLQFVRFSTATIVFIYFLLPYFYENKTRYLAYSLSAILIHFSYLFPFLILVGFNYLPKKLNIYFYFFIISIFFVEIKLDFLTAFLENNLPAAFQGKVESYTNEGYVSVVAEEGKSLNWYITYRYLLMSYLNYGIIIYLFISSRTKIVANEIYNKALCFILLFYGLSNIISVVPSGNRYIGLAQKLFWVFMFFYFFRSVKPNMNKVLQYATIPIFILYIITGFRYFADTVGVVLFIGNPFTMGFFKDDNPLINFIK